MLSRLANLIRPGEAKSSRTAQLIAVESGGCARWTPRDYAALAREGYAKNAIVHRAARLIAENAAACSFFVYEGAEERDQHPLLDLLARPNPRQDGAGLFEALVAHLLIAGHAYAARYSRRQHLFELPGGKPRILTRHRAAAGRPRRRRAGAMAGAGDW